MDKFKINSKVEMRASTGEKTFGTLYDIQDNSILISVVAGDKTFKLFYPGDNIELVIYDEKCLYVFSANVQSRESNKFLIYKVSGYSNIKKFQRRDHVRIPYTSTVYYSVDNDLVNTNVNMIENGVKKGNEIEFFKNAYLEDISGGGLRVRTNEKFKLGLILVLKAAIEDEDIIVKGEVCHGGIKVINGRTFYSYGLKFVNIDETKIDKIVKFVFLLMRTNKPV
ncbi:MAG: PilZ domain-containing protein [Gudongella sp.]|nr:PilZ domain-containing protein [Gudongella sp.]